MRENVQVTCPLPEFIVGEEVLVWLGEGPEQGIGKIQQAFPKNMFLVTGLGDRLSGCSEEIIVHGKHLYSAGKGFVYLQSKLDIISRTDDWYFSGGTWILVDFRAGAKFVQVCGRRPIK